MERTGYYAGGPGKFAHLTFQQWQMLNSGGDQGLHDSVRILMSAFDQWGVKDTLAYVRGGYSGWKQPNQPDVIEYWQSIAAILSYIDQDPALLTDSRRVEVFLKHI